MTATKYRDEILPFQRAHPAENVILVDDNATSHRPGVITAYKQDNNVIVEYWPARSPDPNEIEHAWDMLQRVVNA